MKLQQLIELLPLNLRGRIALTAPEVGRVLGISASAVHGLLARGKLKSVSLDGGRGKRVHRLVSIPALFDFLGAKYDS